ncbi:Asp23/Gls24 family envelope stress response protein [Anaerococcus sp. AGMB00486]|uniref:Asp23/Gls24 family envelope stress response protein n=2 Tax=Anaerococcus TaxID=165779 RepID=A0ABX2N7D9_9FIRM|nr:MULTISPECIES: Asp23/Gls24 family envelope stress response protein [Anaerococcus]MDY3007151.1 Asp23/Gls24 family envelope stress response protein [Anaerococcus porci]MSS77012.1 Asp23/Gls24 family envelope stress response protein [Anaerococcus porci]NVF10499.1 Asp23/Gls24 family envelope stress response protein [Anaerococcus faecalis]
MAREFKYGSVKIANETIETIAKTAAEEINGVVELEELDSKELKKASNISVFEGFVTIDLNLVLRADVNVRKTIKHVQENVKRQVETMTGLLVKRVNVQVNSLKI